MKIVKIIKYIDNAGIVKIFINLRYKIYFKEQKKKSEEIS